MVLDHSQGQNLKKKKEKTKKQKTKKNIYISAILLIRLFLRKKSFSAHNIQFSASQKSYNLISIQHQIGRQAHYPRSTTQGTLLLCCAPGVGTLPQEHNSRHTTPGASQQAHYPRCITPGALPQTLHSGHSTQSTQPNCITLDNTPGTLPQELYSGLTTPSTLFQAHYLMHSTLGALPHTN